MKIKIVIFFLLFVNLYSQTDTLYYSINMNEYNQIAKSKLSEMYEKTNNTTFEYTIATKYKIDELRLLSIPVFWLNDKAKEYNCGDNLEYIINFKNDFEFQLVLLFKDNDRYVGEFDVTYPENEIKRMSDSLNLPLPFMPVLFLFRIGNDYITYNLIEYVEENPDVFIFVINWLPGLWAVKNNRLIALTETCYIHFLGLCKISECPASEYFSQTFGDEIIRHIAIEYGMRSGYRYKSCKEVDEEKIKEIIIEADIKR